MKKGFYIVIIATCCLSACGDLFEYQPTDGDCTMTFDRHEYNLMVGDTGIIHPHFDPDSIENQTVYWMSEHPFIATVEDNLLLALSPGDVVITGVSVAHQVYDTCLVHVMPEWQIDPDQWAYDMVVYAQPTYKGQPLTGSQIVAAFCGDEVRGVGEWIAVDGKPFLCLRIYSRFNPAGPFDSELNPQDPLYPYDGIVAPERMCFRLYDRKTQELVQLPDSLTFDGEAHGTLSQPYPLDF